MKFSVKEDTTILNALESFFPKSSKTTLRSYLHDGRITVEGRVVKLSSHEVKASQTIELKNKQSYLTHGLKVIYKDTHIIAIDKPSGLLSVGTNFETEKTLHAYLKEEYSPNKVYVIHRLDQDTSGVILFALSEKAYHVLKEAFASHDLERSYLAIVEGYLEIKKGSWESYLFEDRGYRVHSTKDSTKGEKAITHYEVLSAKKGKSLLKLTLETGKKNQIRVHCQDAGHPIVGDKKYGSKVKTFGRLLLHAHRLKLKHPVTQKMMAFESIPPLEFKRF